MNNSVSTVTGKIKIKIVFLGNQAVGKSSIIDKYVNDRFEETAHPTVGIDFLAKNIVYKTKNYRLQLWDTAGQQRFRALIPGYLRDAQCALIIFDVSSRTSLNNAESWLQLYNDNKTGQGFTLLVGNKVDLDEREVSQEQGRAKAKELGVIYYEVSAKTGQQLQELFSNIVEITTEDSLQGANFTIKPKPKDAPILEEQEGEGEQEKKQPAANIKLGQKKAQDSKPKQKCC